MKAKLSMATGKVDVDFTGSSDSLLPAAEITGNSESLLPTAEITGNSESLLPAAHHAIDFSVLETTEKSVTVDDTNTQKKQFALI